MFLEQDENIGNISERNSISIQKFNMLFDINVLSLLFQEHSGRVFRLQFDEFQIVSSSHDDTILIWDFLNVEPPEGTSRSPVRTYTYVSK